MSRALSVSQYVCVVARMGTVEEGIWHRRRAPVRWWRIPPFHVRIVRPNPAGMLDHMIMTGKLKLHKKVCLCMCVLCVSCASLVCVSCVYYVYCVCNKYVLCVYLCVL